MTYEHNNSQPSGTHVARSSGFIYPLIISSVMLHPYVDVFVTLVLTFLIAFALKGAVEVQYYAFQFSNQSVVASAIVTFSLLIALWIVCLLVS